MAVLGMGVMGGEYYTEFVGWVVGGIKRIEQWAKTQVEVLLLVREAVCIVVCYERLVMGRTMSLGVFEVSVS